MLDGGTADSGPHGFTPCSQPDTHGPRLLMAHATNTKSRHQRKSADARAPFAHAVA